MMWRLLRPVALLLAVCLLVPMLSLRTEAVFYAPSGHSLTIEGFNEFSQVKNVIVLVLDRLDFDYIEKALEEKPDMFEDLEGFTLFDNAVSGHARTVPALLHMFTGADDLMFQVNDKTLLKDAWTYGDRELLADVEKAGYSTEIYTKINYLFSDMAYAETYVDNYTSRWVEQKTIFIDEEKSMNPVSRQCRIKEPAQHRVDLYAENQVILGSYKEPKNDQKVYAFDDAHYYKLLSASTADRWQKTFKIYHFYGSHAPHTMTADGKVNANGTNSTAQTLGNFFYLSVFFNRLKELGVYDQSTIIITADHGAAIDDWAPVKKATRVGLFYKPAGATGELKVSSAPVCTSDIPATILKAMGADYSAYGPALDETPEDSDRVRIYCKTSYIRGSGENARAYEGYMYTYEIRGHAGDMKNWVMVKQGMIPFGYN